MVKPSLAQNRLGGPPTEVPIPSNLPHAVELCSSSLFKNPKPCVSAFGTQATGPTRPRSCTWMLKNKSRISSNCSFQISRVSNQNRLHLCHDRLWFSGDVCILVIQHREQLEQPFLSSPGHNPFQSLVTVSFFIGNSSLLSLYFSWHSFVRWRAMFVLDYEILRMRSLRVFQLSFAHALTPWGEPRGRLPEAWRRCTWQRWMAATRWSRCCWSPAPPWRRRTTTVADPRAVAATGTVSGRRADAFYFLQHPWHPWQVAFSSAKSFWGNKMKADLSKWILFLSLHDMMLLV